MTLGDDALAAGYDIVDPSADRRDGADEITKTRDYLAQLKAWVTAQLSSISWGSLTGKPSLFASRSDMVTRPVPATGTIEDAVNAAFGLAADALPKAGGTMTGHLYSPPARSTPVTTSYVAAYLNSDGRLGATPSAAKYKHSIEDYAGSALGLRPVTYILTDDELQTIRLGIVADEADEHEPLLVVHEDGEPESFKYELLAVALLRDVQRLAEEVAALRAQIEAR